MGDAVVEAVAASAPGATRHGDVSPGHRARAPPASRRDRRASSSSSSSSSPSSRRSSRDRHAIYASTALNARTLGLATDTSTRRDAAKVAEQMGIRVSHIKGHVSPKLDRIVFIGGIQAAADTHQFITKLETELGFTTTGSKVTTTAASTSQTLVISCSTAKDARRLYDAIQQGTVTLPRSWNTTPLSANWNRTGKHTGDMDLFTRLLRAPETGEEAQTLLIAAREGLAQTPEEAFALVSNCLQRMIQRVNTSSQPVAKAPQAARAAVTRSPPRQVGGPGYFASLQVGEPQRGDQQEGGDENHAPKQAAARDVPPQRGGLFQRGRGGVRGGRHQPWLSGANSVPVRVVSRPQEQHTAPGRSPLQSPTRRPQAEPLLQRKATPDQPRQADAGDAGQQREQTRETVRGSGQEGKGEEEERQAEEGQSSPDPAALIAAADTAMRVLEERKQQEVEDRKQQEVEEREQQEQEAARAAVFKTPSRRKTTAQHPPTGTTAKAKRRELTPDDDESDRSPVQTAARTRRARYEAELEADSEAAGMLATMPRKAREEVERLSAIYSKLVKDKAINKLEPVKEDSVMCSACGSVLQREGNSHLQDARKKLAQPKDPWDFHRCLEDGTQFLPLPTDAVFEFFRRTHNHVAMRAIARERTTRIPVRLWEVKNTTVRYTFLQGAPADTIEGVQHWMERVKEIANIPPCYTDTGEPMDNNSEEWEEYCAELGIAMHGEPIPLAAGGFGEDGGDVARDDGHAAAEADTEEEEVPETAQPEAETQQDGGSAPAATGGEEAVTAAAGVAPAAL